ncbi:MAG: DNA-protecting protein DprA [Frankiales bacterium]|nr:DNA-protecting protein DprA [Frankiales bacterium]
MSVPVADAELMAAAYLSRVAEPGSIALWQLVSVLGYEQAAEAVRTGDVSDAVRAATEARRTSANPAEDLDAAERNGIKLLTVNSERWPHFAFVGLAQAAERAAQARLAARLAGRVRSGSSIHGGGHQIGPLVPPIALWTRGPADPAALGVASVAIVGSRAATSYGEHIAAEWAYSLGQRDISIISGGAYGIDAAAHRGALAAGACTVLVSAGGLDRPYPSGNRLLYQQIAESGLLVSERPPGSAPHRQRFLSRNRLIAALGTCTLLVEAASRSGALNTVRYARGLGRVVLAVPGPVTSAMSVGCHEQLARDENPAVLARSPADVAGYCGSLGASASDDVGAASGVPGSAGTFEAGLSGAGLSEAGALGPGSRALDSRRRDELDDLARGVLDGFPGRGSVTEAELSRISGRPIQQVIAALPALLDSGLVSASREGYRLSPASRPRSNRD